MKQISFYIAMLCCMLPMNMHAQATHWTCDPHAYQYDMAVYLNLRINGITSINLSNYEIAAFSGEECRGVASVQSVGGKMYGYLRIRSNDVSGEVITFKVYNKVTQEEVDVPNTQITFLSNTSQGLPSSPFILEFSQLFIPGDADGDGEVTIFDAVAIVEYYLNGTTDNFVVAAADFNGDGEVDIFDAVDIVEYYLNQ